MSITWQSHEQSNLKFEDLIPIDVQRLYGAGLSNQIRPTVIQQGRLSKFFFTFLIKDDWKYLHFTKLWGLESFWWNIRLKPLTDEILIILCNSSARGFELIIWITCSLNWCFTHVIFSDIAGFMISLFSIYISQNKSTFNYSMGYHFLYHRAEIFGLGAMASIFFDLGTACLFELWGYHAHHLSTNRSN